jgi:hypothetical protein
MGLDSFFNPKFIKSVRQKIVPASLTFATWNSTGTAAFSTTQVEDSKLWEAIILHLATYEVVHDSGKEVASKNTLYAKLRNLTVKRKPKESVLDYLQRIRQVTIVLRDEFPREVMDWTLWQEMHLLAITDEHLFAYLLLQLFAVVDFSKEGPAKLAFPNEEFAAASFWDWLQSIAKALDASLQCFILDVTKHTLYMEGAIAEWSFSFRKRYSQLHDISMDAPEAAVPRRGEAAKATNNGGSVDGKKKKGAGGAGGAM